MWWWLLLTFLAKLVEWLLFKQQSHEALTTAERAHVEKIMYQCNRVRSLGTALGCAAEGRVP